VGSSEGGISKLALELGAKEIIHVDIDSECVDVCVAYLPYGYPREKVQLAKENSEPIHIIISDGYQYIDDAINSKEKFDIIVLDLSDEQEDLVQQNHIYSTEFNVKIKKLLSPEGIYILRAGRSTYWRN